MSDLYLMRGESLVLTTQNVSVSFIPFDLMLTNKRLLLVDNSPAKFPIQTIPLSDIFSVKGGDIPTGDPAITISVTDPEDAGAHIPLDFIFIQAGQKRKHERDDWLRKLMECLVTIRQEKVLSNIVTEDIEFEQPKPIQRSILPEVLHPAKQAGMVSVAQSAGVLHPAEASMPEPLDSMQSDKGVFPETPTSEQPGFTEDNTPILETVPEPEQIVPSETQERELILPDFEEREGSPQMPSPEPDLPSPSREMITEISWPVIAVPDPAIPPSLAHDPEEIAVEPVDIGKKDDTQQDLPEIKEQAIVTSQPVPEKIGSTAIEEVKMLPVEGQKEKHHEILDENPAALIPPAQKEMPHDEERPPQKIPEKTWLSAGAVIVIAGVLIIAIIAMAGYSPAGQGNAPVMQMNVSATTPSPTVSPIPTHSLTGVPGEGTWIRVTYPGYYYGLIGNPGDLRQISGSATQDFYIRDAGDMIQASVQKQDTSGLTMTVDLYTNGTRVYTDSVRKPLGSVSFLIDIWTGKAPVANSTLQK